MIFHPCILYVKKVVNLDEHRFVVVSVATVVLLVLSVFISHYSRNEDATLDSVLSVAVVSGEPCTRYVHINMHNIQDLNKPRELG